MEKRTRQSTANHTRNNLKQARNSRQRYTNVHQRGVTIRDAIGLDYSINHWYTKGQNAERFVHRQLDYSVNHRYTKGYLKCQQMSTQLDYSINYRYTKGVGEIQTPGGKLDYSINYRYTKGGAGQA